VVGALAEAAARMKLGPGLTPRPRWAGRVRGAARSRHWLQIESGQGVRPELVTGGGKPEAETAATSSSRRCSPHRRQPRDSREEISGPSWWRLPTSRSRSRGPGQRHRVRPRRRLWTTRLGNAHNSPAAQAHDLHQRLGLAPTRRPVRGYKASDRASTAGGTRGLPRDEDGLARVVSAYPHLRVDRPNRNIAGVGSRRRSHPDNPSRVNRGGSSRGCFSTTPTRVVRSGAGGTSLAPLPAGRDAALPRRDRASSPAR